MLTLRDIVLVGLVVGLVLWLFARGRRPAAAGCGCDKKAPTSPAARPWAKPGCGVLCAQGRV